MRDPRADELGCVVAERDVLPDAPRQALNFNHHRDRTTFVRRQFMAANCCYAEDEFFDESLRSTETLISGIPWFILVSYKLYYISTLNLYNNHMHNLSFGLIPPFFRKCSSE